MFDPVRLAELIKKDVCRDDLRKYYRFRPSKFYGGISTADCVGCCLRCVFCWAWNVVSRPIDFGEYYHPEEVAKRLIRIAEKKHLRQVRISGNEPTIGWEHLIRVLDLIYGRYLFILETNGILKKLFISANKNPGRYSKPLWKKKVLSKKFVFIRVYRICSLMRITGK